MNTRPPIDAATETAVRRFASMLEGRFPVAGVILFGSRARNTHRPDSDADVAVLLKGEHQRLLPITFALSDLAYDVLMETDVNITPLPVWHDHWEHPERHHNPALLSNIRRDGVWL
ncbi:nucleotidyltransferase family protein [Pseudorhodoferax sp.]|jgi:uncharacterized protein|uniref:nucleotidyltransferase family protein n=1 Tax=Pseudorhodoferax sp. TaxID=1993553 RepID=UPI001B3ED4A5|nr:nucleotidyltransferase domain-containing protein [Pseudorhodoferax sp.]MBP8144784.1 nucleotidyltransferase domain-containing protein [Inhella sp.]